MAAIIASVPVSQPDAHLLASVVALEWRARRVMEGFLGGRHRSPFLGLATEFREYRPYQPGDDIRHVDWRLYARSDRLALRRYEHETNLRAYLLVDSSASMAYRGTRAATSKLELACTLALALGFLLLRQQDAVGLLALDPPGPAPHAPPTLRYLGPAAHAHQRGALLRTLQGLPMGGDDRLGALLEHACRLARRRSLVVLLSDLLMPSEALRHTLSRLRFAGHEIACLQVLDPDELDFPFAGVMEFEDPETGRRVAVDATQARAQYQARFADAQSAWSALLRGLEIPQALVRTDADPAAALAHALHARRRLT